MTNLGHANWCGCPKCSKSNPSKTMSRLSLKQYKMLTLLDDQILSCKRCSLWEAPIPGGVRCKPYWTAKSKYVIVGEAPGREEVRERTPFVGQAGYILWNEVYNAMKLTRENFAIINSVNCRPTDGVRNLKPTPEQQMACYQWVRKFIKIVEPEKMLILGNYAMGTMLGENSGIIKMNGTVGEHKEFDNLSYVISVHPAFCIYNKEEGPPKLFTALEVFRDLKPKQKQLSFLDDRLFEI